MIKIYTTPSCGSCQAAKRYFEDNNIDYTEVDVSQDQIAMDKIIAAGFMSVPVFEIGEELFYGFDRDKINKLLNIKD